MAYDREEHFIQAGIDSQEELRSNAKSFAARVPRLVTDLLEAVVLGADEDALRAELRAADHEWILDVAIHRAEAVAAELPRPEAGERRLTYGAFPRVHTAIAVVYGHVIYACDDLPPLDSGWLVRGHTSLATWNRWPLAAERPVAEALAATTSFRDAFVGEDSSVRRARLRRVDKAQDGGAFELAVQVDSPEVIDEIPTEWGGLPVVCELTRDTRLLGP